MKRFFISYLYYMPLPFKRVNHSGKERIVQNQLEVLGPRDSLPLGPICLSSSRVPWIFFSGLFSRSPVFSRETSGKQTLERVMVELSGGTSALSCYSFQVLVSGFRST